jgi:hypothetical protein
MTVPGSPGALGPGPSLESTATRLGGFRWVDLRLFEVVGGWVPDVPEPAVKRWLAGAARHHAWRADQWADRFPAVRSFDLATLTVPPPRWAAALDHLSSAPTSVVGPASPGPTRSVDAPALAGSAVLAAPPVPSAPPDVVPGPAATGTTGRLAGLVRVVLPRLVVAHDGLLGELSPVADGALLRTLRMILVDELDDWRAGEALLQTLLVTAHDVAAAAAVQARVEEVLVGGETIA